MFRHSNPDTSSNSVVALHSPDGQAVGILHQDSDVELPSKVQFSGDLHLDDVIDLLCVPRYRVFHSLAVRVRGQVWPGVKSCNKTLEFCRFRLLVFPQSTADGGIVHTYVVGDLLHRIAMLTVRSRNRQIFLAETQSKTLGMLIACAEPEKDGVLEYGFVTPKHRRQGILRELEIDASVFFIERGCSTIGLDLDSDNHAAREALTALGYASSKEFWERPV